MPEMRRSPSVQIQPHRQQIHRLRQLSKMQICRAVGKPKDTGVQCPQCKKGNLVERKSRYGKLFYSCSTYPDCNYATWNPPVAETCPKCAWPVLTIKTTKRWGVEKVCPQKNVAGKNRLNRLRRRSNWLKLGYKKAV